MSSLNKTVIMFLVAVLMVGIYMVGCDSTSVDSNKINKTELDFTEIDNPFLAPSFGSLPEYKVGNDIKQEIILEDSPLKSNILNSVINNNSLSSSINNTASGKAWLEEQGYSYVETNSLIMIENEFDYYSNFNNIDVLNEDNISKLAPEIKITKELVRADTITWMAFENPTQDSANHAALITYWRDGSYQQTVYVELDVSTAPPTSIREGLIIGGEFIPEDLGLDFWLECNAIGLSSTAAGCVFTNCGWLHCAAGGSVATLVGCTVGLLFSIFS